VAAVLGSASAQMLPGVATEFEVAAAEVLDERLAAPTLWSSRARQCVKTCRVDGLGGRQIDCDDRRVAAAGLFE
jgi:hypothetical protein